MQPTYLIYISTENVSWDEGSEDKKAAYMSHWEVEATLADP
jgi:hypothetical protein